jgi:nucleotide-binding universal stress UspA family protein
MGRSKNLREARSNPMKILLPIDDSPFSTLAIQTVLKQAQPKETDVLVLHVLDVLATLSMYDSYGPAINIEKIEQERESRAQELVKEAAEPIRNAGFSVTTRVERGEPKRSIVEIATEWGAELIVLGSHGRKGVDRFLLGGVSEAVVRHAHCSVLIVRSPELMARLAMKTASKCAHPGCTCVPRSGKYCSAACEATATMPDIDCRCGHPECKGRAH